MTKSMLRFEYWLSSSLWIQGKFHTDKMRSALHFFFENQKQEVYVKLPGWFLIHVKSKLSIAFQHLRKRKDAIKVE